MFGKKAPPISNFDTLISGKAEIVGDIHFSGGLHIDGKVYGNIIADDDSKAVLRVSDKGVVEGEVSVPHVIVNGTIIGDVHSCEHLELAAKATVKGDVFYNTVEMVMGSQVEGRLAHRYKSDKSNEKAKMPKKVTKDKPKPQTALVTEEKVAPKETAAVAAANRHATPTASIDKK